MKDIQETEAGLNSIVFEIITIIMSLFVTVLCLIFATSHLLYS